MRLRDLPPSYYMRATFAAYIDYLLFYKTNKEFTPDRYENISISNMFGWHDSLEGTSYWAKVHDAESLQELPPHPTKFKLSSLFNALRGAQIRYNNTNT